MCILAYHMVDSFLTWGVTRVAPHLFFRQIKMLQSAGKEFLTISDYLELSPLQQSDKIAITFDDGYASVFNYAFPILEKFSVPASVFVNPAYIGQFNTWDANFGRRVRHLDWRQIRTLKGAGWEIGSHGMTHQDLTTLSRARLEREFLVSRRLIEHQIGMCSPVFSFPFGNSGPKVRIACKDSGYKSALAMGGATLDRRESGLWSRVGVYLFEAPFLLKHKVLHKSGIFITLLERVFDACSNLTVKAKSKKWHIDKN